VCGRETACAREGVKAGGRGKGKVVEGREGGGEGGKERGVENSRESGRDGQAHVVETYGKKRRQSRN